MYRTLLGSGLALSLLFCQNVWAVDGQTGRIVIVRQVEKSEPYIGQPNCQGLNRALALPKALLRFGKPDYLFTSNPADKAGGYYDARPLVTIEPAAIAFGLSINIDHNQEDVKPLAAVLTCFKSPYTRQNVWISWPREKVAELSREILKRLGAADAQVQDWDNNDYDRVDVITITQNGPEPHVTYKQDNEGLNNQSQVCPVPVSTDR